MNVQVIRNGSNAAVIIELGEADLALLKALNESNGGLTAGATDPNSPLRKAATQACQLLFPTIERLAPGYQMDIPAG